MEQINLNWVIVYADYVENYGVINGVILSYINYWTMYHEKKDDNFIDGYYWSGGITVAQLSNRTGLTERECYEHLEELINNKILIKAEFTKKGSSSKQYRLNTDLPDVRSIIINEFNKKKSE